MITFSKIGEYGRLGNQLFQIAAVVGMAKKMGVIWTLPKWNYESFFFHHSQWGKELPNCETIQESNFHCQEYILDPSRNYDLIGYFQSEKYFTHCKEEIKELFDFYTAFKNQVKQKLSILNSQFSTPRVALSVRRGDYVNNSNYVQIGLDYYERALQLIPKDAHIIVFSDDFPWCKEHIPSILNSQFTISYTDGLNEIESMCAITMCDHFIIPNSTFAWWGAWLGEKDHSIIVAPDKWFGPRLAHKNDKDIVPERWKKIPVTNLNEGIGNYQIDLKDVTFTIPVHYDHPDRKENLDLIVCFLQKHFDTNIMVYETGTSPKMSHMAQFVKYKFVPMEIMHRTKILNLMAKEAETEIIFNYDADVLFHPSQILETVNMVRSGNTDACYPYDGRFVRLDRSWHTTISKTISTDSLRSYRHTQGEEETTSFGGAICWNRESFFRGGGENEKFIAYGPEDYERYERFTKLGFTLSRVKGCLYHINHYTGPSSNTNNPFFNQNNQEYEKIKSMDRERLIQYVADGLQNSLGGKNTSPEDLAKANLGSKTFDKIYCVNMAKRNDRKIWAEKQLSNVGIKGVSYFDGIDGQERNLTHYDKDITPGMIGCFLSHRLLLKEALDCGYESIVVFEDDIQFIDRFPDFIEKAFKEIPEDWQFAYLGAEEHGGYGTHKQQINKYWVIPNSVWGTHAYMLRGKETIQKMHDSLLKMHTQIDMQWGQFLPTSGLKYYCLFPTNTVSQNFDLGGNIQRWNDIETNEARRAEVEKKSPHFSGDIEKLQKQWKEPFKKAAMLHIKLTEIIVKNFQKIKKGQQLSEKVIQQINDMSREKNEIIKNQVRPLWNQIDAMRAGMEPEKPKVKVKEWVCPETEVELMKEKMNLRTYISKIKNGKGFYPHPLEVYQERLRLVEEKLNSKIK